MLTQCLAAPLGALVEWAWLGMGLSGGEVLCGVLVLAGVGTALAPGAGPRGHSGSVVAGTALGVMAAAGQGIGAVLSRKAFMVAELATENVDGITAAYQRIVGGLVLAGLALWFAGRARGEPRGQVGPRPGPAQRYPWRTGVLWVGLNAVAGPALGVSCYQWALKTSPTGIVLAIVATTPLVVIPFAHYWEGERQTRRGLAGCAVAVAGTVGLVLAR
jgi:drug/metabolite transporter (DMT)-like permease